MTLKNVKTTMIVRVAPIIKTIIEIVGELKMFLIEKRNSNSTKTIKVISKKKKNDANENDTTYKCLKAKKKMMMRTRRMIMMICYCFSL